ncbi:MAG: 30S ribosomal protein S14 [SAR202 cluster bacterium]|nr:30S ribosomal protein S14 [Chloroflexota bacterium]MQG89008.1 30S ribosomal protein S14 [SAR202 cluster bacterium]
MAKKSMIEREKRRQRLVEAKAEVRKELRAVSVDMKRSPEERFAARQQLAKLPRNSSPIRLRNRCAVTGRPRGYIRFFGLSRITFRDLALKGELPGIRKGSL